MAILLIDASTSSAAAGVVTEAQTGTLWGVSLGTTTKLSTEGSMVLVECTTSRANRLADNCPDGFDAPSMDSDPNTFTSAQQDCQGWFLRGKLGE